MEIIIATRMVDCQQSSVTNSLNFSATTANRNISDAAGPTCRLAEHFEALLGSVRGSVGLPLLTRS
jgi:hypothetical protein